MGMSSRPVFWPALVSGRSRRAAQKFGLMSELNDPAEDVVRRCRNGDEQAARWVFDQFAQRLTRLAEQHLNERLRRRVDPEDVVQSVFRTFFHRVARGEFRIQNTSELWHLLVKITLTKVRLRVRRDTAAKRNIQAETSEPPDAWMQEVIARGPGPSEAAALVDLIETILKGLPRRYAEILVMHLEGYSAKEIGRQLEVSRQTVGRALATIRQRALSALRVD